MDGELEILCRACGLCCDGSLFGRVGLEPEEVEGAKKHRLRVVESGKSFAQPCAALVDRACSIYDERPLSCRRFTCRLYERHRAERGPIEPRLASVRRVRELLSRLDREGAEADPEGFAELVKRLEEDFARAMR